MRAASTGKRVLNTSVFRRHCGHRFVAPSTLDVSMGLSVKHLTKTGGEFIRQAWFRKERREAIARRAFAQGPLKVAAHRDNRDVACSRVLLQVLEKLPAVTVRH